MSGLADETRCSLVPECGMVSSNMAASRVASASRRLCLRYQLFFFVVFFLLVIQLYLAFSFWTYSQQEMDKLEAWKKRVERLEEEHKNEASC